MHYLCTVSQTFNPLAYYLDLFSPETYEAFSRSDRTISGFRTRHRSVASRIRPGDRLICYVTGVSRWAGVLEVVDGPFDDASPIFYEQSDPFTLRFKVKAAVWLPIDKALPIHADIVWSGLSFTKDLPEGSIAWTGKVRGSLARLDEVDGRLLEQLLLEQSGGGVLHPLDDAEARKMRAFKVRRADKDVSVTVPEAEATPPQTHVEEAEVRESHSIQALLADIGSRMGMQIWIPRSDRASVQGARKQGGDTLLERLPLNYDDTTLKTIEQIDVLWLKGRSIKRAFEVEHTTSIYSGILRMADLLALQPNMDIRLHIVAPSTRRERVFSEIRRPVFSLLESGALSESCTYLSYDSIRDLAKITHLEHMSDTVLDEYEEEAEV